MSIGCRLCTAVIVCLPVLSGCSTGFVPGVNESGQAIRITGCVDDMIVLNSGQTYDQFAVNSRCAVYAPGGIRYLGCVLVDDRAVVIVANSIDSGISEGECS